MPQGGIGEAVALLGTRLHMLAINELPPSGQTQKLPSAYGIGATAIVCAVKSLINQDID